MQTAVNGRKTEGRP